MFGFILFFIFYTITSKLPTNFQTSVNWIHILPHNYGDWGGGGWGGGGGWWGGGCSINLGLKELTVQDPHPSTNFAPDKLNLQHTYVSQKFSYVSVEKAPFTDLGP